MVSRLQQTVHEAIVLLESLDLLLGRVGPDLHTYINPSQPEELQVAGSQFPALNSKSMKVMHKIGARLVLKTVFIDLLWI